ncbi:FtsW/RodA/SpoVE family cell cycle protein [Bacillus sp. SL00103]
MTAPYRLKRLTSFRDPFQYEDGDGYQLIHSYLAMNSGGLTGNVLGGSIQKARFLSRSPYGFYYGHYQ